MTKEPLPNPKKNCQYCEKTMIRKRMNGRLEDLTVFRKRKYCDQICMAMNFTKDNPKREQWLRRSRVLKKDYCEVCGKTATETSDKELDIHHIDQNWRNNDPANIKTLCGSCHLKWHWKNGKLASVKYPPCRICGKPSKGFGLCLKHYQRFKKYGDPLMTKIKIGLHYVLVKQSQ